MASFLDELTKIADTQQDPKKNKKRISAGEVAAGMAVGTGINMVGKGTQIHFGRNFALGEAGQHTPISDVQRLKHVSPQTPVFHSTNKAPSSAFVPPLGKTMWDRANEGQRDTIRDQMRRNFGAPREATDRAFQSPNGAVFSTQHMGPHVVAHELGHAKLHKSWLGKATTGIVGGAASTIGQPAAVAMAATDPDSRASKWAPVVGAASQMPRLVNEGLATYHGYRGMQQAGFSPEQLAKARTQLGRAYGTYASKLIPAVGLPLAMRGIRKFTKKRRLAREAAQQQQMG